VPAAPSSTAAAAATSVAEAAPASDRTDDDGEKAAPPEKEPGSRYVDADAAGRPATGRPARSPSGAAAAESRKLLASGERLLHAERFAEAREIFQKVASSRHDRGLALVGLAEISFQEKNYTAAVRSARLAAERGGGVRARVLLGDAHFRLDQFKEAAKAYEEALKLDPKNASAKSGLALAQKRM
jgi:tetratricopeptide (TPR) repeat protein